MKKTLFQHSRRFGGALAALALAGLMLAPPAPAQDTPRELRQKAIAALGQGDYKAAIPFLSTLTQMLGTSKTPAVIVELETIYFNLAMCHFLTGGFGAAGAAFDDYLKKYRQGFHAKEAAVYRADALRFQGSNDEAIKSYNEALKKYGALLNLDWTTDIYCSMAKCQLHEERWKEAGALLERIVQEAPDFERRNWAASILAASYLKNNDLAKVYRMNRYLLHPDSYASRSVYFNLTALEAGDLLFADDKHRDALWVYRMVYPKGLLLNNCQAYRDQLGRQIEALRKANKMREILRAQEKLGEIEQELKTIAEVNDYDSELAFRIARSYQNVYRHRAARDLFYSLYLDQAATNHTEECLYLAFSSAAQAPPPEKALEIGDEYMTRYPASDYYGEVSLNCGQIYANMQDWQNTIGVLTNALAIMGNHPYAAECMFLVGYSHFMQEQFPQSIKWLTALNTRHPGNDRFVDATYWLGMANMFEKKYDEAKVFFDKIIADYPDAQQVEDSCFRTATCDFGLSRYAKAEPKFVAFLERYPQSKLRGEANLTLGDIAGALGKLPRAISYYQKCADDATLNVELYNYAMFRCGEIMVELKDYDGIIRHFEAYIQRVRPGSNIPMAISRVGNAYWEKGQLKEAMAYYRGAIEKYGKERKELGIDLILEDWVGRSRKAGEEFSKNCWKDMRELHRRAVAAKEQTLALRIERIMLFDPANDQSARAKLLQSILQENNLEFASAGILDLIAEEALKADDRDLAIAAANKLISDFPETDYAVNARMLIARGDIQRGENADEAIMHLTVVREVFPASFEAGEARLLLGELYGKQRNYAEADRAYKELTESKEWKKMWPAAIYGRGEIRRAQKKFKEASAFYERLYVLYGGYPAWAAKAYLRRAECLEQLFERQKAVEVLEEMIAQPDFQSRPEMEEARQLLAKLKKQETG